MINDIKIIHTYPQSILKESATEQVAPLERFVGVTDGVTVGLREDPLEGVVVGFREGPVEGVAVGFREGPVEGEVVGLREGPVEGVAVGFREGPLVGVVGDIVGLST